MCRRLTCMLVGIAVASAGCLQLGGKTYVHTSAETEARLAGLESRVKAIEEALRTDEPTMPRVPTSGQTHLLGQATSESSEK